MKFTVMSFNVRGLNEASSVDKLHGYIRNQKPKLDLLFLQKTKLRNEATVQLGQTLWRGGRCWSLEATIGYTPNGHQAGRGGIATLLSAQWSKFVSALGSIMNNRGFWFILGGIPGGDLGFLNIYAPNKPIHQCILWEFVLCDLPRHCKWILVGDFNMVEVRVDKSSHCSRIISKRERHLFNSLKEALGIHEPSRKDNGLRYIWNNLRLNGIRVLMRLDRVYAFAPDNNQFFQNYKIHGNGSLFDHCPISILVQLGPELQRPSRWKMSTYYLKELKPRLKELWEAQPSEATFFRKLKCTVKFYREYCK